MFRRIEDTLEPDPGFPADLKHLGFFVNNTGHIRMIDAPEKPYIYHATNSERVNEVRREAMQACQREESERRLHALGLERIYFPGFTTTKPIGPHIPILSPALAVLKVRKRIIVVVNDSLQDLGILAYRQLQRELGVNGGSLVNFAKEMIRRSSVDSTTGQGDEIFADGFKADGGANAPALVILNTGQLLYSHKLNRALTLRSWSALRRKSIVHEMVRIHEENRVKGHRDPKEHVRTFFEEVLCDPTRVAPDAEVYFVAIEDGTGSVLDVLEENFDKYGSRITAMALVHSTVDDSQIHQTNMRAFLHQRARHWKYSDLTEDPYRCIDLPTDYSGNIKDSSSQEIAPFTDPAQCIRWNENIPALGPLEAVGNALSHLRISVTAAKGGKISAAKSDANVDWSSGQVVVCPTFAGGTEPVAECVFTNPAVQQAILSFFEEVAQKPEHYRNPCMQVHVKVPQPTPHDALELSVDEIHSSLPPLSPEMTPEQAELDAARQDLNNLLAAFEACPTGVPELAPGVGRLKNKIRNKKVEIEDLEQKGLATGGLKAGEAVKRRETWKPHAKGIKMAFAGSMVDSELLRSAGLFETVKTGLEKVGDSEEKGFI